MMNRSRIRCGLVILLCTACTLTTASSTPLGSNHADLSAHLDVVTDLKVKEIGRGRLLVGNNWDESGSSASTHDTFKHHHDGRVLQPYDDYIQLDFVCFGKPFSLDLEIMDWLIDASALNITNADGESVEQGDPFRLTSYHARIDNGTNRGWASVTLHDSGSLHAVVYLEQHGEVIQLDPVSHSLKHEHEHVSNRRVLQTLDSHTVVARRLSQEEAKHALNPNVHSGMMMEEEQDETSFSNEKHAPTCTSLALNGTRLDTHSIHDLGAIGLNTKGRSLEGTPSRWTNCFPDDHISRRLRMGLVVDNMLGKLGSSAATSAIQEMVADANAVYMNQLNIQLTIGSLIMQNSPGQVTWDEYNADGTCNDIFAKFDAFANWANTKQNSMVAEDRMALWHIISGCYRSGVVGVAYVGTLCGGSNTGISSLAGVSTWVTFAHEVGHNFGAHHSFEDGKGQTGGIMDYGDGLLDDIYQFNTKYRKTQVCNLLAARLPTCSAITKVSTPAPVVTASPTDPARPVTAKPTTRKPTAMPTFGLGSFTWIQESQLQYSSCTSPCGGGTDTLVTASNRICVNPGTNQYASSAMCLQFATNSRPRNARVCNTQACPVSWATLNWSQCSCSSSTQTRVVYCKEQKGSVTSVVADQVCASHGVKPPTSQSCAASSSCFQWRAGPFGTCSAVCGPGVQTRTVRCYNTAINGIVDNNKCPNTSQPSGTQGCMTQACVTSSPTRSPTTRPPTTRAPTVTKHTIAPTPTQIITTAVWAHNDWGVCTPVAACGAGISERNVACYDTVSKKTVLDLHCQDSTRPFSQKPCMGGLVKACPVLRVEVSQWSRCSASCGFGTMVRQVQCVDSANRETNGGVVDMSTCNNANLEIPHTQRSCLRLSCSNSRPNCYWLAPDRCNASWHRGEWSACTAACGGGTRTRLVTCQEWSSGTVLPDEHCAGRRPVDKDDCNAFSCPRYEVGQWSDCDATCGTGFYLRSVECVDEHGVAVVDFDSSSSSSSSSSSCNNLVKPPDSLACAAVAASCGLWAASYWDACDATCAPDQMQERHVSCLLDESAASLSAVRSSSGDATMAYESIFGGGGSGGGLQALVSSNVCDSLSQPQTSRACPIDPNCPDEYHWRVGTWSTCFSDSSACTSSGSLRASATVPEQERSVVCVNVETQFIATDESMCESITKPITSRSCSVAAKLLESGVSTTKDGGTASVCIDYQWKIINEGTSKEYGSCSQVCGDGQQQRRVLCVDASFTNRRLTEEHSSLEMVVSEMNIAGQNDLKPMFELYSEPLEVVNDALCEARHGPAPERSRTCQNNVCLNDGECKVDMCMCAPGFKGPTCDISPVSKFEMAVTIGTELENEDVDAENNGVLPGDPLYVSWSASAAAPYGSVDVYLQQPNNNLPIILSDSRGVSASHGSALVHIPLDAGPPGAGYSVLVVVNQTLCEASKSFVLLEGCDMVDCGTNGRCERSATGAAVCACRNGYSGKTCSISPCVRAGCLNSRAGVNECVVSSTDVVTCVCNQGYRGSDCSSNVVTGCQSYCQNDAVTAMRPETVRRLYWVAPEPMPEGSFTPIGDSQEANDANSVPVTLSAAECAPKVDCLCAEGTMWTGAQCKTCALTCHNGGQVSDDCSSCTCANGFTGDTCTCPMLDLMIRIKRLGLNSINDDSITSNSSDVDTTTLTELLQFDLTKALKRQLTILNVTIVESSETHWNVAFNLFGPCTSSFLDRRLEDMLANSATQRLRHRLTEPTSRHLEDVTRDMATSAEDLRASYLLLYSQAHLRWSPLRARGILLSGLDDSHGIYVVDHSGMMGDLKTDQPAQEESTPPMNDDVLLWVGVGSGLFFGALAVTFVAVKVQKRASAAKEPLDIEIAAGDVVGKPELPTHAYRAIEAIPSGPDLVISAGGLKKNVNDSSSNKENNITAITEDDISSKVKARRRSSFRTTTVDFVKRMRDAEKSMRDKALGSTTATTSNTTTINTSTTTLPKKKEKATSTPKPKPATNTTTNKKKAVAVSKPAPVSKKSTTKLAKSNSTPKRSTVNSLKAAANLVKRNSTPKPASRTAGVNGGPKSNLVKRNSLPIPTSDGAVISGVYGFIGGNGSISSGGGNSSIGVAGGVVGGSDGNGSIVGKGKGSLSSGGGNGSISSSGNDSLWIDTSVNPSNIQSFASARGVAGEAKSTSSNEIVNSPRGTNASIFTTSTNNKSVPGGGYKRQVVVGNKFPNKNVTSGGGGIKVGLPRDGLPQHAIRLHKKATTNRAGGGGKATRMRRSSRGAVQLRRRGSVLERLRGWGPQMSANNSYHNRERVAEAANLRAKACADLDLRLSGKEIDIVPVIKELTRAEACAKLDERLEKNTPNGGVVAA